MHLHSGSRRGCGLGFQARLTFLDAAQEIGGARGKWSSDFAVGGLNGTEATSKIQPPVNGGPSVANALNPGKIGALAPATTGVPATRPPLLDPVARLEVRLEELLNDPSLKKFRDFMGEFNFARKTTDTTNLNDDQAEELEGRFIDLHNRAETCLHKIGRRMRLQVASCVASQLELAKVKVETRKAVDAQIRSIVYVEAEKDFSGGFGVLNASKAVLRELRNDP